MRNNFIEGFLLSSVFCFSYFWDHWRNSDKENLSLDRKRRRKKTKQFCIIKIYFYGLKSRFVICRILFFAVENSSRRKMKNNLIMNREFRSCCKENENEKPHKTHF